MKFKSSLFLSIALASSAFAQTTITPVPSSGYSINDNQIIAGSSNLPGGAANNQASVWNPAAGTVQELTNNEAGTNNGASGINFSGNVAGCTQTGADVYNAYAWTSPSHSQKDLGALSGQISSFAGGINNSSWVAGNAGDTWTASQAAVWKTFDNGNTYSYSSIGHLAGGIFSYGASINSANTVAGYAYTGSIGNAIVWNYDAATSSYTSATNLHSTVAGIAESSAAYDINSTGSVVGHAAINSSQAAVLWQKTGAGTTAADYTFTNLGANVAGASSSEARGINDAGKVVGNANMTADAQNHASLWDAAGAWTDLNTLVGATGLANAGFSLLNWAHDINNNGDITGWGEGTDGLTYAYLLTAGGQLTKEAIVTIPEPTSSVLLGLAGMTFLVLRKRK